MSALWLIPGASLLLAAVRRWWAAPLGCLVALVALALLPDSSWQALWLSTGGYDLEMILRLDGLSRAMLVLLFGIGLPVSIYARESYEGWLSFFLGAMAMLFLAGSTVLLFFAWEAVGVASFVLIAQGKHDSAGAARQALLMTRASDVFLLLAWLYALVVFGTTDIARLGTGSTVLAVLLVLGALGKSAQFPLTAWLPRAMAGPTPVSALLHSATMVAAGAYLLVRFFSVLEASPTALSLILAIGAATALLGALAAAAADDLKRILAYSTVSQLGEMMLALGLAGPAAAAVHLLAHGAFKSSLFLSAGCVEHATGSRRLSQVGGLMKAAPVVTASFAVAALALAGIFPFSGYWSEDLLLGEAHERGPAWTAFLLLLIGLAGLYIGRAFGGLFLGRPGGEVKTLSPWLLAPTAALALAAGGAGGLIPVEALGLPSPSHPPTWLKALGPLSGLLGLAAGAAVGARALPLSLIDKALQGLAQTPARLARGMAAALVPAERTLDRTARGAAYVAHRAAHGEQSSEAFLDGLSRWLGRVGTATGSFTARFDEVGLREWVDRWAEGLGTLGGHLREAQSGKLYLYAMGLFGWTLAAVLTALIWL